MVLELSIGVQILKSGPPNGCKLPTPVPGIRVLPQQRTCSICTRIELTSRWHQTQVSVSVGCLSWHWYVRSLFVCQSITRCCDLALCRERVLTEYRTEKSLKIRGIMLLYYT
jgi:hypothetical protein